MKLIYVVIDGLGDLPIPELRNETPLGVADTPNLDRLAWNGKTGLMYTVGRGVAPESDVGVISILGYDPFKFSTGRGVLEAIGAGLSMKDGDLALRCNFATLGRNKRIVDRRAGRNLTSKEALALSEAVNSKVKLKSYPAAFEFKSTVGHRAVLVMKRRGRPLSSKIANTDPAYVRVEGLGVAAPDAEMILKKCKPTDKDEEANAAATLINEFTEKSHRVLESHRINKRRAAEGKLKANLILTRDAGHILPNFFNINQRFRVRFACLADMPVERGIAELAGMRMVDLPPPSKDLKEDSLIRVKTLLEILPRYDCFYIHIKGPDEPGHDGNFKLKIRLIETIDKYFFGRLLPRIDLGKHVVCVTSDHATPCRLKNHSDDPVPVLIAGDRVKGDEATKFSEKECKKGSLGLIKHGTQLMPMLMHLLKSR
ncbi:MAG TPA: alkaline phosphatase family protein [Candidatus Bathyarchaeia archaeon]|nr:alkaline phosphatase family protein [Candidatus Bathyarchaeia archaeon]